MTRLLFIADFFVEHLIGGGELNNEELIHLLTKSGFVVETAQSHLVTQDSLIGVDGIIIANFINLNGLVKEKIITGSMPYIIYEHDHKYLKTRNPADYEDFIAPPSEIINFDFYKNARAVLCQSKFHADIVTNNLLIDNIINLSGNLWSISALKLMESLAKKTKNKKSSIMKSRIPHKNTIGAVNYCHQKGIEYDLIEPDQPEGFLENISKNENLIFFPLTPETFSRIVVETRMMNMNLTTNELVGATKEPWFKKKGLELIEYFVEKREEIVKVVKNAF